MRDTGRPFGWLEIALQKRFSITIKMESGLHGVGSAHRRTEADLRPSSLRDTFAIMAWENGNTFTR